VFFRISSNWLNTSVTFEFNILKKTCFLSASLIISNLYLCLIPKFNWRKNESRLHPVTISLVMKTSDLGEYPEQFIRMEVNCPKDSSLIGRSYSFVITVRISVSDQMLKNKQKNIAHSVITSYKGYHIFQKNSCIPLRKKNSCIPFRKKNYIVNY
jgi:hypothetical protein